MVIERSLSSIVLADYEDEYSSIQLYLHKKTCKMTIVMKTDTDTQTLNKISKFDLCFEYLQLVKECEDKPY